MTSFWEELNRRNVVRVGIAYVAGAWALIQAADVVLPNIGAPAWIIQALIYASALGFPIALALAWAYEVTPDGIKASADAETAAAVRFTGRRIDFAIIALLVLAVGFLLVSRSSVESTLLPNSVAVLPFENLSPDPDNEYFAAGIHEEILNRLVRLRNLSVISRTSMLRYANTDLSIPEIANELNVEMVMEGTVRYSDDRVRITTQLIDAATDKHVWSETYDRMFSDIFAIESDIAMNIANALAAEFSLATLERYPTDVPEAYRLYLKALEGSPIRYLNEAIRADRNFALAYATRAYILSNTLLGGGGMMNPPSPIGDRADTVLESAQQALALDPTLGMAHVAMAALHQASWRGAEAEEAFKRAYELFPDAYIASSYGRFKSARGEYDEAIRLAEEGVRLDPNNAHRHILVGRAYHYARDYEAAVVALERALELTPTDAVIPNGSSSRLEPHLYLAFVQAERGNFDEAVRHVEQAEEYGLNGLGLFMSQAALAYSQAGRPQDAMRLFAEIQNRGRNNPRFTHGIWARSYIAVGDYDQALQQLIAAANEGLPVDSQIWIEIAANPWREPELDAPRFREYLDNLWDD